MPAISGTAFPPSGSWVQFGPGDAGPGDTPFAEWTAPHPATKPDVRSSPDDVVSLAPTGGTTGLPKGVMNTNRSLSAFATHLMMAAHYGSEDAIVNLAAAPMTHTAGLLSLPPPPAAAPSSCSRSESGGRGRCHRAVRGD